MLPPSESADPLTARNVAVERAPGGVDSVKSALRALTILEILGSAGRPLPFREVAAALRYPRSSLHGLLRTLVDARWVEFDPVARSYSLGIRAWEVGHSYLRFTSLASRAQPYMESVRDTLNETVQLAVLDGRYNVYIAKVDGDQQLVLASQIGRRLEAHATGLGKVLLADLSDQELHTRLDGVELERFTSHTIVDFDELRRELERIRERGYAADREEYTLGVQCVAVPIYDHSRRVVAAMSVSAPIVRLSGEGVEQAIELLRRAAWTLSLDLGLPA